jgi:hypothetical protein
VSRTPVREALRKLQEAKVIELVPNRGALVRGPTLRDIEEAYVVPQVHIYAGESFDDVAESMFGYQTRSPDQRGAPFDARTVRSRSQLRGPGRVALPMVFARGPAGWQAVWLHLYLRGRPVFNRVEDNTFTTSDRVRALVERRYLTVSWLLDRWRTRAEVTTWDGRVPDEPVTFVGIDAPADLPEGSEVYTLDRLAELIPA